MAIRYAIASGNWSDSTIWDGGTLPTSADDVYANTFTIAIDQDINVLSLQSSTATGISDGGTFTCSTTRNIIASGAIGVKAGLTTALSITAGTTNLYSNVNASNTTGPTNSTVTITNSGTVLNVIGNVTGSNIGTAGITATLGSSLNITGNVTGGAATSKFGVVFQSTGALSITGTITPGSLGSTHGIIINTSSPSNVTITGNVFGGPTVSSGSGISGTILTTYNATGSVTSGSGTAAISLSQGNVNVTGSVTAVGAPAINTTSTVSVITFTGPLISSSVGTIVPILATKMRVKAGQTNSWIAWRDDSSLNGNEVRWQTSDLAGGNPSTANVRLGTIFGTSNEFVGTLAVPPANSVAAGVPVDNSIGTAAVKLEDIAAVTGAQIVAALSRE